MPKKVTSLVLSVSVLLGLVTCSPQATETPVLAEGKDPILAGDATLAVTGLPNGAKVVTLTWFEGQDDDHFQGEIYEYTDGMTIPAGKVMLLIEGEGFEPLMARRIPVYGDTVLKADMCKLDEGCYGTLTRVE